MWITNRYQISIIAPHHKLEVNLDRTLVIELESESKSCVLCKWHRILDRQSPKSRAVGLQEKV